MISIDYGKVESLTMAKVQEDFTGFDAYKIIAERHGVSRNDVKISAYHIFYFANPMTGKPWLKPNPTKEDILSAIELACAMNGLIDMSKVKK